MESIINNNKKCFKCGSINNLHCHHIFFGGRNRNKSEKDGLKVYLCWEHHEGTYGVHGRMGHNLDIYLKQIAEKKWLEYYNKTIDDFIKRYGRNFL